MKDWAFIDLGDKSEGFIAADEFTDDEGHCVIKEGDTIEAYFLSSRNNEKLFTTRISGGAVANAHLEDVYEGGIPVEGLVEKEVKGGFEVKIAGNIRAFCPYSQMGHQRVEDVEPFIGQKMTFKIIEYGEKGRNIIVSHRVILEEERQKTERSAAGIFGRRDDRPGRNNLHQEIWGLCGYRGARRTDPHLRDLMGTRGGY